MSKLLFVKDFKTISIFDMTVHALENCNLPSSWQDWDQVSGSPDLLKEAYMKVRKEVFSTLGINFFCHCLMLIPLWFTGKIMKFLIRKKCYNSVIQIWKRHAFLSLLVGTLPLENQSYSTATHIVLIVTAICLVLSLLEVFIFPLYNKKVNTVQMLMAF